MESHWRGPHASNVRKGVEKNLSERYRDHKWRFKDTWFVKRDGEGHPREIRRFPPENMVVGEWGKLVDFYTNAKIKKQSATNKVNRAKKKDKSHHGTKSYAARRHDDRDKVTGEYPSVIDHWGSMHCPKGKWDDETVKEQYLRMVADRDKKQKSSTSVDENAIMDEELGTRRGWKKGRGRIVSIGESSTSNNQSQGQRLFTQEEVKEVITFQRKQSSYMTSLHSILQQAGIAVPKLPKFPSLTIPGVEEDHEESDDDDSDYDYDEEHEVDDDDDDDEDDESEDDGDD